MWPRDVTERTEYPWFCVLLPSERESSCFGFDIYCGDICWRETQVVFV